MKCPVCPDSTLLMADRQGVEIDYCPSCRGVWLDRGELDKILERGAAELSAAAQPQQQPPMPPPSSPPPDYRRDHDRDRYRHSDEYEYRHPKRRKSFLEDLFD